MYSSTSFQPQGSCCFGLGGSSNQKNCHACRIAGLDDISVITSVPAIGTSLTEILERQAITEIPLKSPSRNQCIEKGWGYLIPSQDLSAVREQLKKHGVRFGTDFVSKSNLKPDINLKIFTELCSYQILLNTLPWKGVTRCQSWMIGQTRFGEAMFYRWARSSFQPHKRRTRQTPSGRMTITLTSLVICDMKCCLSGIHSSFHGIVTDQVVSLDRFSTPRCFFGLFKVAQMDRNILTQMRYLQISRSKFPHCRSMILFS
jgi:hypothetical protein